MVLLALALQGSLLVSPMFLQEDAPQGRSAVAIMVSLPGSGRHPALSKEEALQRASDLRGRLLAGEPFGALAQRESDHPSSRFDGNLGTVWPGMLPASLDDFLFSAELGALSEPILAPEGAWLLKRIEPDVAWRAIQVNGTGAESRARIAALAERLAGGEDFAELARAHSDDKTSAERGGVVGIFQRGPRDALVKKAAEELAVGEVSGVIETPFALYIVQRLDAAEVSASLREPVAIRARGILVSFARATGADPLQARSSQEAEALAKELASRIRGGEDMGNVAAEFNDDPGGRERRGDLGWIHRIGSDTPMFMDRLFTAPIGDLIGPLPSNAGWVLLRRER